MVSIGHGAAIDLKFDYASIDVAIPRGYTREAYVKSVIDYWTPERMASAKPMHPMITKNIPSFSVNHNDDNEVERIIAPSTIHLNTRNSIPAAAGRIFFVMNNQRYVCSGSVVTAENRDTVVTAGHCVFNNTNKEWVTNLSFVPRYESNDRPFGTFVARRLVTTSEWKAKVDYNFDTAIVLLNRNENGEHVQDLTGGFGLSLNAAKKAATKALGYPMNINNGEIISTCDDTSVAPTLVLNSGFKGLQIKCGMGGGASGGPWLQNYNSGTQSGQQVSLTSFSYALAPGKIHGPHFNNDNMASIYIPNQKQ